ncbi:MAG: hypothetical protein JWQ97_3155 [Phenylobacterium sp.]|nr:hypothetical protein [Phenylobacterium sp.]
MPSAPRLRLAAAALLVTASALSGCVTPKAKPKISQAVLDARAHRDAPATPACPQTPLAEIPPVMVGYAFNDAALPDVTGQPLAEAARWLACHPATAVAIKPDADSHGTPAEQDALARARAEAVQAYLASQGVTGDRVRLLARGAPEPAGDHLVIRAEGRRW